MTRTSLCLLLLLAALCGQSQAGTRVSLFEGEAGRYLRRQQGEAAADAAPDLATLVTSLLGVPPLSNVDRASSDKVASLLTSDPFGKPEAVAVFSTAGLSGELSLSRNAAYSFQAGSAGRTADDVAALKISAAVEHASLDVASLPGCGELCLESMTQEALHGLGLDANYTPKASAPLRGQLMVRLPSQTEPFVLDLHEVPDRLLAIEIVAAWKAATNIVSDRRSRAAAGLQGTDPVLVDQKFWSLAAFRTAYGPDSSRLRAGTGIVQRLVEYTMQTLSAGFEGRIVFVISSSDESISTASTGSDWGKASKAGLPSRSLLAAGDSPAYTNGFIAWILMWCTFFLLLFFALAGCHCLRHMKFKQDSLLYGKNKVD